MSLVGKGSQYFSGFAPTSIPGCGLWLDAADRNTFTLSGSNVTQWRDKSGNSRNFSTDVSVAPSGAVPPTYGTSNVNNLPVVSFSNQSLWAADFFTATQSFTVFFVGTSTIARGFDNYGNGWSFGFPITTGEHLVFVNNGPAGYAMNPNPSNSALWSATVSQTTTSVVNFWNGGTLAASSNINNTGLRTSTLGFAIGTYHNVTFFRNGYIGEVIIYTVALDAFQRQAVEGYLANKWNLTIPSTHALKRAPLGAPPFTPTTFPGCQLWLDADDTTSLTLSGSNVTAWRDKSSQAIALTVNGTPTYSSRGIQLSGTQWFTNATATVNLASMTVFLVGYNVAGSDSAYRGFLSLVPLATGTDWNQSTAIAYTFLSTTPPGQMFTTFNFSSSGFNQPVTSTSNPLLFSHTQSGTSITLAGFGTNVVSSTLNFTPGTSTGLSIGARYQHGNGNASAFLIGTVYEIIIYGTPLTTSQRQTVEAYLGNKWGLTASVPSARLFNAARPFMRPFVPVDISGCALWLDGMDPSGTGVRPTNNTTIATWVDKSGRSNNAVSNASYSLPTYNNGGVTFTGTNALLLSSTFPSSYDICVVGAPLASTASWRTLLQVNVWPSASTHIVLVQAGSSNLGNFFSQFNQFGTLTWGGSNAMLFARLNSNLTMNAAQNGTFALTAATPAVGSASSATIILGNVSGDQQGWGTINEFILFSTALTTGERQQVETYLANKWGLRGSTPSNHPARLAPALTTQFNPLLLSDCALWLDGGDATVFTMSGSNIVRWDDRSGNNRHAVSVNNPVLGTTTTGRQAVVLSGTNYFNVSGASTLSGGSMTIFAQASATTNGRNLLAIWGNTRVITFQLYYNGANFFFFTSNTVFFNSNAICCIVENISTNVCSSFFNGRADNTMAAASRTPNGSFILGANHDTANGWIGNLQEVIIYNRALPTAERQAVEGYLANKWGLVNTLPNGHPFKTAKP